MVGEVESLNLGLLLASRRPGLRDAGTRADADLAFEAGGRLPLPDRSVGTIALGDAAAALPLRDQVQLMMDCRRLLRPGGLLACVEPGAAATHAALARWAELAGLCDGAPDAPGWSKPAADSPAPLVSIMIPAWNPRFFAQCLDSAIAQTYRPLEIVICDDCPGDGIEQLALARAGRADIRYQRNPKRFGARANYEHCLTQARGELVKFLNDDDLLAPDCVATLAGAFRAIPGLTLATSHRWRINEQSQVIADIPATQPAVERDLVIEGISLANAMIMYGLNFIGEPTTALFRKRDFDRRPHLDAGSPFHFNGAEVLGAVDFAMWSRLLAQGDAVFFRKRLSSFRVHGEQTQAQSWVVAKSIDGIRELQQKWIELGLFRRYPPHLLACRPYAQGPSQADDWRLEAVRSVRPHPLPPEQALRAWRATPRHPFDTA
jgi:glycosyltransferase involved in cell wall biosynthesis